MVAGGCCAAAVCRWARDDCAGGVACADVPATFCAHPARGSRTGCCLCRDGGDAGDCVSGDDADTGRVLFHLSGGVGRVGDVAVCGGPAAGAAAEGLGEHAGVSDVAGRHAICVFAWTVWKLGRDCVHTGGQSSVASNVGGDGIVGHRVPDGVVCRDGELGDGGGAWVRVLRPGGWRCLVACTLRWC